MSGTRKLNEKVSNIDRSTKKILFKGMAVNTFWRMKACSRGLIWQRVGELASGQPDICPLEFVMPALPIPRVVIKRNATALTNKRDLAGFIVL